MPRKSNNQIFLSLIPPEIDRVQHGGSIHVESEEGVGSVLPLIYHYLKNH